jgi:hypothetical protein
VHKRISSGFLKVLKENRYTGGIASANTFVTVLGVSYSQTTSKEYRYGTEFGRDERLQEAARKE